MTKKLNAYLGKNKPGGHDFLRVENECINKLCERNRM